MATFVIPNAPQVNTLEAFTSVINKYGAGLAQACRYLVIINTPKTFYRSRSIVSTVLPALPFLCEQAEMPGKTLSVQDARYYGPNFKYPVQTEYSDVTLTFLVRDQMLEKEFFDNWMMTINPNNTYDFSYKSDYVSQINIIQYSAGAYPNAEKINSTETKSIPTYKVTLVDAFPTIVAPMGLVWGEEGFHRVVVTFAYTEFKRDDDVPQKGHFLVETGRDGTSKEVYGSVLGGAVQTSSSTTKTR